MSANNASKTKKRSRNIKTDDDHLCFLCSLPECTSASTDVCEEKKRIRSAQSEVKFIDTLAS